MFGVSPKKTFKSSDQWKKRRKNEAKQVAFQSGRWFNKNGKWNDINTSHFECVNLEVDLLLDIDDKKLNVCVVGQCAKGKEVKIWDFEVSSKGFVPYFNLLHVGQQLQCIKIPISWYGVPH